MKPDEHKKKKNEQYKKKHAIKTTKNESKVINQRKGQTVTTSPAIQEAPEQISDHNSMGEQVLSGRRTFQRRKIESNWDRYTEPSTHLEQEQMRGADFKDILANTSTAISQFRFKDEQILEDSDIEIADVISIDCDALIQAVHCIPLHDRLQIEPVHFQESHLEKFNEVASRQKVIYDKNNKSVGANSSSSVNNIRIDNDTSESYVISENCIKVCDENQQPYEIDISQDKDANTESVRLCDELDDILNSSGNDENKYSTDMKSVEQNTQLICDKPRIVKMVCNNVSDVEYSLNHSTEASNTVSSNSQGNTNFDADLDALLKMSDESTNKQSAISAKPAVPQVKVETENLEDWLDSVLDD